MSRMSVTMMGRQLIKRRNLTALQRVECNTVYSVSELVLMYIDYWYVIFVSSVLMIPLMIPLRYKCQCPCMLISVGTIQQPAEASFKVALEFD